MSIVLHILKKDLRHLWVLAALSVIFSLLETVGWYWAVIPYAGGMSLFVGQIIPVVIQFILSVAIVQADPTVGDRAFWRTRPIPYRALLAAKLAFLLVVFVVPSLAVNFYLAASMDAPLPVLAGMVIESTGMILVEALVAALIGSMTENLIQAAAALLGAVLATAVVSAAMPDVPVFSPWRLDIPNHAPRMAALGLYSGLAALILLSHQFATRRTGRTLVALAVLVPAVLFAGTAWPVTIRMAARGPAEPASAPTPSQGVQVMLFPPAQVWSNGYVRDPANGRIFRTQSVAINAAIRSVPDNRIVELDSISSQLLLDGGEQQDFPSNGREYWRYWTSQAQATSLCRHLGLTPPSAESEQVKPHYLRLFAIANEKAKAFWGRRGTLTATLKLHELAFRDDITLPARSGATWVHGGQMWRVGKVGVADGGAVAEIRHMRVTSMLITEGNARPDPWSDVNRHGFVLLNRKKGEFALSTDRWNSQDTPIWAVEMNQKHIKFGDRWQAGGGVVKGPIDDAWLADAELVILAAEPAGTLTKSVVLENFVLPAAEESQESAPAPFWQ